ncbi:MAG: pitrilysin family protein [Candidatus Latescibacterota bacterium]|nr:pitrilysin family protein [Candidatus Latescibacterota bacterium]
MQPVGEFTRIPLAADIDLHLHRIALYKTVRVDICISEELRPQRNSRLALISRLLERGTRDLPDLQSLNRFIDDLYGAHYYAEVDRLGDYQFIHLCLEVIDEKFLERTGGDVLARGVGFLHDILLAPAGDSSGFHREYLEQEKLILTQHIADRVNDKMAYAQQRCVEEMCRGESIALSPLGDPEDFGAIDGDELLQFHRSLLAGNRIDLFLSGDVDQERALSLAGDLITWDRDRRPVEDRLSNHAQPGEGREIFEYQDVHQAKLVLGYRTRVLYGTEDYPVLILLNMILGGEGQSRLFKCLREEGGLCYYVGSHIEALSGLLFIVAGIGPKSYYQTRASVEQQLEELRQGYFIAGEIESARRLLQAHLLSLGEDREAYFRYQFRTGLVGGSQSPLELWRSIERVGVEDLTRVIGGLVADTAYMLHGGMQARIAL